MSKDKVDRLNVKSTSMQTEEFNRPDHPDFMDSNELKKTDFTGYRTSKISGDCEIWLLGEVKERISPEQLRLNPMAVSEAMERIFALDKALPDTKEVRAHEAQKAASQGGLILLPPSMTKQ